ncbi:hypothetical protein [Streptomyces sp. NPDC053427]|uniref:hypothetical protein n=1 Tax=Streptomyces sp. NPDC053427 TaxID=3365701 RepID=UPI0037D03BAF
MEYSIPRISYASLLHLDLSGLLDAVEAWDSQIRILQTMDSAYVHRVIRPFFKAGWSSMGFIATAAHMRVAGVNKEFGNAVREAQGIRGVLCDTHDRLKRYKDELHRIVEEDARHEGLVVNTTGVDAEITPRQDAATDPDIHEEGGKAKAIAEQQSKIDEFAARIEKVLRDATDTDRAAAAALRRNLGRKPKGFNDKVSNALEADESERRKRTS